MNVLVTGGAGFVAGHLRAELVSAGHKVFLSEVVAVPYWTRSNIRAFAFYAFLVSLYFMLPTFTGFFETLLIRQRLAAVDSAAYYMISRFAEIGTYAGATLSAVVFPFASERQSRGESTNCLILVSASVALAFGCVFAGVLYLLGPFLFSLVPDGASYLAYLPEMAALAVVLAAGAALNCGILGEIAAGNFRFLWWWVPLHLLYGGVLMLVTGFGYFVDWLPQWLVALFKSWLSNGLWFYIVFMAIAQAGKMLCLLGQKVLECRLCTSTCCCVGKEVEEVK